MKILDMLFHAIGVLFSGKKKEETCRACSGRGSVECQLCTGKGMITVRPTMGFYIQRPREITGTCHDCRGMGRKMCGCQKVQGDA